MNLNPVILIILFLSVVACQHKLDSEVDVNNPDYTTSVGSQLRFKNIRQIDYTKRIIGGNDMHLLQLKDHPPITDSIPMIGISIAHNWKNDEAYLVLEPSDFFTDSRKFDIKWKDKQLNHTGTYHFKWSRDEHFKLAGLIHKSILKGHELYYVDSSGSSHSIFVDNDHRSVFRKTMIDFYRLVDLDI